MEIPKLYNKPDFNVLMKALYHLEADDVNYHDTFTAYKDSFDVVERHKNKNSLPLSIIRSPLDWLAPGEADLLYNLASKRIAERCGRAALPEMTRKWEIPANNFHPKLEFTLREPPLTGDNLGLKTWATSYVVSKNLGQLGHDYLSHLFHQTDSSDQCLPHVTTTRVLELGSGTGLVGISAAAIWGVPVFCTDLEPIQENLAYNIKANKATISENAGGSALSQTLDWRYPEKVYPELQSFEFIIAADPLYDDFHPSALANTIHTFVKKKSSARVLIAIPFRDKHTVRLSEEFTHHMISRGFLTLGSTSNICKDDDWKTNNDFDKVIIRSTIWRYKFFD